MHPSTAGEIGKELGRTFCPICFSSSIPTSYRAIPVFLYYLQILLLISKQQQFILYVF